MSQWQAMLKLDSALQGRVRQLYEGKFPREIRHHLCCLIESQDWDSAVVDENKARVNLHAILMYLDEHWNRSLQENNMLQGPDYQGMKDYFLKHFEYFPMNLAVILSECLREERKILAASCGAWDFGSLTPGPKWKLLDNTIHDIKRQTLDIKQEIKSLEDLNERLAFIQKNLQSRVEEHVGLAQSQAVAEEECLKQANFITQTKQMVLQQIVQILNIGEKVVVTLQDEELPEWKRRQQLACIGSPADTSLDHLEKWFTAVAEVILEISKQLQKLQDLIKKYNSMDTSSLTGPMAEIKSFALSLLKRLLSSALVVEQQPVMASLPQRPLIIKTGVRFTVTVRFLANLTEFVQKCLLKVRPVLDKDVEEAKTVKGFRQFEFNSDDYKLLDVYTSDRGFVADFGHMSLKDKKGKGKGSQESKAGEQTSSKRKRNQSAEEQSHLAVTEELHIIKFVTEFQYAGLDFSIETSSLPLVVISSTNQIPSAWASVMWFNVLSTSEPRNLSLFLEPPSLTWQQLSQLLSWQFLAVGQLGLNENQLSMLREKFVVGPDDLVHWKEFSKIETSAWFWIEGILDLIKRHLLDLWQDGSIMGFVSKVTTRALLQEKQTGTFLLRFSESSKDGAITFSWVEHINGETHVHAVEPYTKQELLVNALPDVINRYSLTDQANTSRKPLLYLYPNIHKDAAFGRYYKTSGTSTSRNGKDGYVPKKFIPVSNNPTPPPSPTRELEKMDMEQDKDLSIDGKQVIQELFPDVLI